MHFSGYAPYSGIRNTNSLKSPRGTKASTSIIDKAMGIVIGYIVDSKARIKELLEADNFYEAEHSLSLYHEYEGLDFQLPHYAFTTGTKGWAPMFHLLHLAAPSSATVRFFNEQEWIKETPQNHRMLHLSND